MNSLNDSAVPIDLDPFQNASPGTHRNIIRTNNAGKPQESLGDGERYSVHHTVKNALDRLEALDASYHSTIELLRDSALLMAQVSDQRKQAEAPRALEGLPFTVKDVIDVAGARTTGGSRSRSNASRVRYSADVIERLTTAGAIPIAKDSTTEFAIGGMHTPMKGACLNPWNIERWSGGSSSGTAVAVASGVVPFGIGTDVNGSVRMPAAFCGVTGLKPTKGRISKKGVLPMSWSTEVVGPIARDAAIIRAVFSSLAPEQSPADALELDERCDQTGPSHVPETVRLAVLRSIIGDCDRAVIDGLEGFLECVSRMGVSIANEDVQNARFAGDAAARIVGPEASVIYGSNENAWHEYDVFTRDRLLKGLRSQTTDYLRAKQLGVQLQKELHNVLGRFDAVVIPSVPGSAPRVSDSMMSINGREVETYSEQSRYVAICSLTGFPAISFPTGFDKSGCPVSTMLISSPGQEHLLISLVEMYQSQTQHHRQMPDLSGVWSRL